MSFLTHLWRAMYRYIFGPFLDPLERGDALHTRHVHFRTCRPSLSRARGHPFRYARLAYIDRKAAAHPSATSASSTPHYDASQTSFVAAAPRTSRNTRWMGKCSSNTQPNETR